MASNVKIVIVGDGSVGKTSLCNVFVNQSFPTNHDATVFENFSQELYVCGQVWPNIYRDNNDKVFTNVETSEISNQTTIRNSILSKKHKFWVCFGLRFGSSTKFDFNFKKSRVWISYYK